MTAVELLADLRRRDIYLWIDGENLRCRAPKGVLTDELRTMLADRKTEILAWLKRADAIKQTSAPLRAIAREGDLPLSFSQERLWFLDQLAPDSVAYNIISSIHFRPSVDVGMLQRSLDAIVERHEALRTTFSSVDGQPVARIARATSVFLPIHDLRSVPAAERAAELMRIRTHHAETPFNLADGPLFRVVLVRGLGQEDELLMALHHIVSDRWSLSILTSELNYLYKGFLNGGRPSLPALPVQYVDFAVWQRERIHGGLLEKHIEYWRHVLTGELPVLDLPIDHARPSEQTYRGAWENRVLSGTVSSDLTALAAHAKATPFMIFVAALTAVLHRYTGQRDILLGTPISGRTNQSLEGVVGCFLNMLVLRTDLGGDPTFAELLARVREAALGAYTHAELPFERLVADIHPRRDPSRSPLFQVAISFQSMPKGLAPTGDVATAPSGGALFDLTLFVAELPNGMSLTLEYNTDLFEQSTVARMLTHLETLLVAALEDPNCRVSALPLVTAEETRRMVAAWNDTAVDCRLLPTVHESVAARAKQSPDTMAIVCGDDSCTYRELDARANHLAWHLQRLGAGPEMPVGLYLERSIDMVVAMLGILKAGSAYVPLDPAYPRDRIAYMVRDAGLRLLVTQGTLVETLPEGDYRHVCVDRHRAAIEQESADAPPNAVTGGNLAYIIYTSGSTGRPKGVQISHVNLANILASISRTLGLSSDDVFAAVTTLSFDIAALELLLPLTLGARVVVVGRDAAIDGTELQTFIKKTGATAMQATPATWRLLLETDWRNPRFKMLCGGEALPPQVASELLARGGELWNLYGPTETTIWSTTDRVDSNGPIAIGRPFANTQVYVLDDRLQLVPPGVSGEVYIAGAGVARGYCARPDLTAERFLPDLFGVPGSRMYRTGDIGRYRGDGRLECLGRTDHQVKVRGFRIELAEIETILRAHPAVKETLVVAHEGGDDKRLVAYSVHEHAVSVTASELRRFARAHLPDYMVPSFFVTLDRIPLTPNGKVDRGSLPASFGGAPEIQRQPPSTPTEERIADIWRRALGVEWVSADDNFFDIGGHSLLSMRVISEIERLLKHRLSPRSMFMENLRQIGAHCDRAASTASAIAAVVEPSAVAAGAEW